MFSKLAKAFSSKKDIPERIVLRKDSFALYCGEDLRGEVFWREVSKIIAFKEDLVTFDLICIEFIIRVKEQIFTVNDDINGFWDLVNQIKKVFPESLQDWDVSFPVKQTVGK